jgi:Fur family transcriptional regulator, zinc uptake regulator
MPSRTAITGHTAASLTTDRRAHDHGACVHNALHRAEQAFEAKAMKLTPLRRLVFAEIAGSHDAVGAYDVLDRLARKTGERMAPVSVYRAIDALLEAGVVHRLESRNAFFACHTPHKGRRHIALVEAASAKSGFAIRQTVVEVAGQCSACAHHHDGKE